MQATDDKAFLRRAAGRMVVARRWIYGAPDERLRFTVVFGACDDRDLVGLLALWRSELALGRHVSLFDAAQLTSVTPQAFAGVGEALRQLGGRLTHTLERQALVRPSGITGTIVAGYYHVFPPPYPFRVFDDRASALAWLGYGRDALAAVDAHVSGDATLGELRRRLAAAPHAAQLAALARALGLSPRSLQRRLGAVGTSFQREVTRARLDRAMQLIAGTDLKLAAVAAEVGCASLVSFSEMFTREVGVPPSQWRATQVRRDPRSGS